MKLFFIITLTLTLIISCTSKSVVNNKTVDAADKKIEGAVVSKEVPNSVKGFKFNKTYNTYFRNDLTESLIGRIIKKLNKGESPDDNSSRFSSQVQPITSSMKYPFWSDYFGDTPVSGSIQLNILVSKIGKPEVIIVEKGINPEVDMITVSYVKDFLFKPAIHKKSNNPTRAWIKIRNTF